MRVRWGIALVSCALMLPAAPAWGAMAAGQGQDPTTSAAAKAARESDEAPGDQAAAAADSGRQLARDLRAARDEQIAAQANLRAVEKQYSRLAKSAAGLQRDLRNAQRATRQAERGMARARRDLGNLARMTYGSVPSELATLAALLDAGSPTELLRRMAVLESVTSHQDSQWSRTVESRAKADRREAKVAKKWRSAKAEADRASAMVGIAEARLSRAVEAVKAIGGSLLADAPATGVGASQLADLCGDRTDLLQCFPSGWGEGGLTLDAVWLMRTVAVGWPQIVSVGGYRAADPYPDHPSGRAVDVMIPDYGSAAGAELGDDIAVYLMENAERYGISYMIWRQRIWRQGGDPVAPPSQWRTMGDRGGDTANHLDHLHITVSTGNAGIAVDEMLQLGTGGPPEPRER